VTVLHTHVTLPITRPPCHLNFNSIILNAPGRSQRPLVFSGGMLLVTLLSIARREGEGGKVGERGLLEVEVSGCPFGTE